MAQRKTSNEAKVTDLILDAIAQYGVRLFRTHVGQSWHGNKPKIVNNILTLNNPRRVTSGIKGMSDFNGYTIVEITPEMVGQRVAIYTSIEMKDKARVSPEQLQWIETVKKNGGFAGVAHTPEDALAIIGVKQDG